MKNMIRSPFETVQQSLASFAPIDLAQMNDVSLLDRVDTKYLLGLSELGAILPLMTPHYRILDIGGVRLNRYHTLYFDTNDFTLYRQHHNGLASRYKVRARKYLDTDVAFFEIKHKTNRSRTIKSRLPIPDLITQIGSPIDQFIDARMPLDAWQLEPKLWNEYLRITLVGKHQPERITIDLNLKFGWGDAHSILSTLAIVEVKQSDFSQSSVFIQHMRRLGIRPASFSKYCVGVWSLYQDIKVNNFKSQIRMVKKLMEKEAVHASLQ